jgi:hypothetical protein
VHGITGPAQHREQSPAALPVGAVVLLGPPPTRSGRSRCPCPGRSRCPCPGRSRCPGRCPCPGRSRCPGRSGRSRRPGRSRRSDWRSRASRGQPGALAHHRAVTTARAGRRAHQRAQFHHRDRPAGRHRGRGGQQ